MKRPIFSNTERKALGQAFRKLLGLSLMISGAALTLALLSYDPRDPGVYSAHWEAPSNWLGVRGAYAADLLMRSFGIAGYGAAALLLFWGARLYWKRWISSPLKRLAATPFALLAVAIFASAHAATAPGGGGLGGLLGDFGFGVLAEGLPFENAKLRLILATLIALALAAPAALFAFGGDWSAVARLHREARAKTRDALELSRDGVDWRAVRDQAEAAVARLWSARDGAGPAPADRVEPVLEPSPREPESRARAPRAPAAAPAETAEAPLWERTKIFPWVSRGAERAARRTPIEPPLTAAPIAPRGEPTFNEAAYARWIPEPSATPAEVPLPSFLEPEPELIDRDASVERAWPEPAEPDFADPAYGAAAADAFDPMWDAPRRTASGPAPAISMAAYVEQRQRAAAAAVYAVEPAGAAAAARAVAGDAFAAEDRVYTAGPGARPAVSPVDVDPVRATSPEAALDADFDRIAHLERLRRSMTEQARAELSGARRPDDAPQRPDFPTPSAAPLSGSAEEPATSPDAAPDPAAARAQLIARAAERPAWAARPAPTRDAPHRVDHPAPDAVRTAPDPARVETGDPDAEGRAAWGAAAYEHGPSDQGGFDQDALNRNGWDQNSWEQNSWDQNAWKTAASTDRDRDDHAAADVQRGGERAFAADDAPAQVARPEPADARPREVLPALTPQPPQLRYRPPSLDLLTEPDPDDALIMTERMLAEQADRLQGVLNDYGVKGDIIDVHPGPVVTLFELEPAPGLKAARVIGLADDIARSMSAVSARISTIPGRNVIGIELPNDKRETVLLRELLAHPRFARGEGALGLALGKDIAGEPVVANLARMPHLLIAGTTGSGKSVSVNAMILSLLYRLSPDQVRMIMIDPKMLELSVYNDIPHLLAPVVTDPKKAVTALKWAVREMERRYERMADLGARGIDSYNQRVVELNARGRARGDAMMPEGGYETMPRIVVVVDEMADLMLVAGKEIEHCIQRLAQMARAAGIHLIMATQRPSVDVITGTIKANFPIRISFQVTSKIDSRTILGEQGAEQLLGRGDMLYSAGGAKLTRIHGPFVSDEEVEEVAQHLRAFGPPAYRATFEESPETQTDEAEDDAPSPGGDAELYDRAVALVQSERKASTSFIQRRLQIGYNRAARIIEMMEAEGVVSAANHVGKREILIGDDG